MQELIRKIVEYVESAEMGCSMKKPEVIRQLVLEFCNGIHETLDEAGVPRGVFVREAK